MKKVNAYQINPAYQDSNIFDEEFEKCFVDGGKNYRGINIERIHDLLDNWGSCVNNIEYSENESEKRNAIDYWLDIQNEDTVCKLLKLAHNWGTQYIEIENCNLFDAIYGGDWDYVEIRGCRQGDYAILYYDKEYWKNSDIATEIEVRYFNMGSEWRIEDDGEEMYLYCISWNDDDIKKEIAREIGCKVNEITFHKWKGEKMVDIYEEF